MSNFGAHFSKTASVNSREGSMMFVAIFGSDKNVLKYVGDVGAACVALRCGGRSEGAHIDYQARCFRTALLTTEMIWSDFSCEQWCG
jgi:hypothetical protein